MKAWSADGKRVVDVEKPDNLVTWDYYDVWSPQEVQDLTEMVKFGLSHDDMAIHLGRTKAAVISKMHHLRNAPHGA